MIPTLESPADFISDRAFFQDYANAKVYRIALDQSFLEEISMSFKGEVEVSFDFLRLVSDPRAITFKGDLLEGEELPETANRRRLILLLKLLHIHWEQSLSPMDKRRFGQPNG